jgi:hypothetical protein
MYSASAASSGLSAQGERQPVSKSGAKLWQISPRLVARSVAASVSVTSAASHPSMHVGIWSSSSCATPHDSRQSATGDTGVAKAVGACVETNSSTVQPSSGPNAEAVPYTPAKRGASPRKSLPMRSERQRRHRAASARSAMSSTHAYPTSHRLMCAPHNRAGRGCGRRRAMYGVCCFRGLGTRTDVERRRRCRRRRW